VLGRVSEGQDVGVYVFAFEKSEGLPPFGRLVADPANHDGDCVCADRLDGIPRLVVVWVYGVGLVFGDPEGKRFAFVGGLSRACSKEREERSCCEQQGEADHFCAELHGISFSTPLLCALDDSDEAQGWLG
jgi:hypothetical protein